MILDKTEAGRGFRIEHRVDYRVEYKVEHRAESRIEYRVDYRIESRIECKIEQEERDEISKRFCADGICREETLRAACI